MHTVKRLLMVVAVGGGFMLGGCNEQATVQMHKPGVYKGAADPLLEIAGTPEQNARLEERLLAVQTDR